jgi:hypothetical protein
MLSSNVGVAPIASEESIMVEKSLGIALITRLIFEAAGQQA